MNSYLIARNYFKFPSKPQMIVIAVITAWRAFAIERAVFERSEFFLRNLLLERTRKEPMSKVGIGLMWLWVSFLLDTYFWTSKNKSLARKERNHGNDVANK